jgi:ribosomal protein S18 acetylase RimI-like enzyme
VGVAVCIGGFSTFAGRPLINVHDLAVMPTHRGRGIGRRLLEAVAERARQTGCCKVTLEVRTSNADARRLYERLGFSDAGGQPTQFLERRL